MKTENTEDADVKHSNKSGVQNTLMKNDLKK